MKRSLVNEEGERGRTEEVPKEIWITIARMLAVEDAVRLSGVSHAFYRSFSEMIWVLGDRYTGHSYSRYSIQNQTLKRLNELQVLELVDGKDITNEGLSELTRLEMLDLSGNTKITNDGIRHMTSLTFLKLSNNFLITDDALIGMTKLKFLDLQIHYDFNYPDNSDDSMDPDLDTCPKTIGNDILSSLPSLTYLNLTGNRVITVEGLLSMKNLKSLFLASGHCLTDGCLSQLTSLEVLHLRCDFRITGSFADEMTNLQELTLHQYTIFEEENIRKLTNLTLLDLEESELVISDATLFPLTNLTSLNLGDRSTGITPTSLMRLTRLTTLTIEHMELLPPNLSSQLPLLQKLTILCDCPGY